MNKGDKFLELSKALRGRGKTHTLMTGVQALAAKGEKVLVMCHNAKMGRRLKKTYPGDYQVCSTDLNNLDGFKGTVVVEHGVADEALMDMAEDRHALKTMLRTLIQGVRNDANRIEGLLNDLVDNS